MGCWQWIRLVKTPNCLPRCSTLLYCCGLHVQSDFRGLSMKSITSDLTFTSRVTQVNVSTSNKTGAHPTHRPICGGRWSTRRPRNTSLSSGCLCRSPCRSRSSPSPGCSRGRLSGKIRRTPLWQPVSRTTARTTSPTTHAGGHPAELAALLA